MEEKSFASFFFFFFRFSFLLFLYFLRSLRPLAERNAATRRVILLRGKGERKKNLRFEETEGESFTDFTDHQPPRFGRAADPRAKRSSIRASVPRIVALLSSSRRRTRYKNVPGVPSLPATPCGHPLWTVRRWTNEEYSFFSLSSFFSRWCTDPGIPPLPSFFFYTEKNGSINGIGG